MKKNGCALLIVELLMFVSLSAEEPKPAAEAKLHFKRGNKDFRFDRVVAYEYKSGAGDSIAVLFSDKDIPIEKLKTALQDGHGSDDGFVYFEQHIKFRFSPAGELKDLNAYADHTSLSVAGTNVVSGSLAIKDRRVIGKATLNSDGDTADASFDAPLLEVVITPDEKKSTEHKPAKTKEPKEPKAPKKDPADTATDAPKKSAPATPPAANGPNVYTLPIPKDAVNTNYRKLTGQVNFTSDSDIKTLADFYVANLEPKGWVKPGKDLISAKSAILKRTQGDATLSIFVRPADKGCTVQIISKGLNWDEPRPENESPAPK